MWILSQAINCWKDFENRRLVVNECREHFFSLKSTRELFRFLQETWLDEEDATIEQILPKTIKPGLLDIFLDVVNIPVTNTPIAKNIEKLKRNYLNRKAQEAMESGDVKKVIEYENEIQKLNEKKAALYEKEDVETELILGSEKGVNFEIYSTGLDSLDEYYKIVKKQTTILTGIPGSGKSNFADQIAVNMAAKYDWKILLFSPENQPIRLHLMNIARKWSGVPIMGSGKKINNQWIVGHFNLINTNEMEHDIDAIIDIAEKEKPDLFIIDPWNEILITKEPETQFISESLSKLKSLSYRADCHIIIIAHPTKMKIAESGKYKDSYPPVNAYDISGSAMWYSKPDNILSLWRDKMTSKVECYIQKIKFEGVTGKRGQVDFNFIHEIGGYK